MSRPEPESIEPSYLGSCFRDRFGESAQSFQPISAHASGRSLYRVKGSLISVVATVDTTDGEYGAFVALTEHFLAGGLPVPTLYAAWADHRLCFVEDLGDTTLLDLLQRERTAGSRHLPDTVRKYYEMAISELPRFQVKSGRDLDFSRCHPSREFNVENMIGDLRAFEHHYLAAIGAAGGESLYRDALLLAEYLAAGGMDFFMYRDFQARNIMVHEGKVRFIDYQGGRKGPLQYDPASLLYQSSAALLETDRTTLLEVYLDALSEYCEVDRTEFRSRFDGFVVMRLLQVLGTYGRLGIKDGKQYFYDSIPRALENLRMLRDRLALPFPLPALFDAFDHAIESPIPPMKPKHED